MSSFSLYKASLCIEPHYILFAVILGRRNQDWKYVTTSESERKLFRAIRLLLPVFHAEKRVSNLQKNSPTPNPHTLHTHQKHHPRKRNENKDSQTGDGPRPTGEPAAHATGFTVCSAGTTSHPTEEPTRASEVLILQFASAVNLIARRTKSRGASTRSR